MNFLGGNFLKVTSNASKKTNTIALQNKKFLIKFSGVQLGILKKLITYEHNIL